jgi:hypothetical protein
MPQYGRQVLPETVGNNLQVQADGYPEWIAGGATIDWSTVTAQSGSDVTYNDGTVVRVGQKALRYGTVLAKITSGGSTGKWGPADTTTGIADGRQTASRGNCGILNETVKEGDAYEIIESQSSIVGLIEGGMIYKSRLANIGGSNQFTFANLESALPRLRYATL